VRRAVCIGDSFTWGVSVLFDDAWPQRVERILARERGERWEAVNLGEPGLNTVQEVSRLASEGFAYGPDVVVVAYVLNDSEDETAAEARRAADWVEEQRRGPPSRSRPLGARAPRAGAGAGHDREPPPGRGLPLDVRGRLRGLDGRPPGAQDDGGLCRERGVPSWWRSSPLWQPLDDRYPFGDVHLKVTQAAAEAGAQVVDLLPLYRGSTGGSSW